MLEGNRLFPVASSTVLLREQASECPALIPDARHREQLFHFLELPAIKKSIQASLRRAHHFPNECLIQTKQVFRNLQYPGCCPERAVDHHGKRRRNSLCH